MILLKAALLRTFMPLLLFAVLLTGCWSSRELSDSAILSGAAIEKIGGEYKIIYQVMDPKKIKKNESKADVIITSEGPTVHEATLRLAKGLKRRLFLSHTRAIIISTELARKEGILPLLDFGNRDQQFRLNSYIYVADHPAKILGLASPLDPISAFGLFKGTDSVKHDVSEMTAVSLREFMQMNQSPVGSGYVTLLKIHKEKPPAMIHVDINGAAVFKDDKLVKVVRSPLLTRGILWFENKVKFGSMSLPIPGDPRSMAAIELHSSSSKIKPKLREGKLTFDVNVEASGDINEWQSGQPLTERKIKQLELQMKKQVIEEMNAALKEMRKDPATDILNLGMQVYRHYPKYWHQVHEDWDEIFKRTDVRIHVKSKITNLGMVKDRVADRPQTRLFPGID
ncbi:Ger(x)C family spore germination protein [Ferviditalea candida]|uniref:Ger(X)C family spore germination protein n=1 Tax=Ferviditalea candida TaxID=3108399 RepID=A0ABU5ZMI5_9BACL|nr:Ger(x)C family spore germination protein [Paenibacillaceae bacterium T2]